MSSTATVARAKSAMEEAGWDGAGVDLAPPPTEEQLRAEAKIAEDKARQAQWKRENTERKRRERERGAAVAATNDIGARIARALPEDFTLRQPLPLIDWQDSPGLMVGTDGKLLFALRRVREAEWSVVMAQKADVPGMLDSILVEMVGTHKSHCEAMEFAEGLRAGWYLRVRAEKAEKEL